jgi:hypothetical protein
MMQAELALNDGIRNRGGRALPLTIASFYF